MALRKGSRVRIANEGAMITGAGVKVGQTGRVTGFQDERKVYAYVLIDKDRSAWSIPVEGLEHIKRRK